MGYVQGNVDGVDRYWQQSLSEIGQCVGKIAGCVCDIIAAAFAGNCLKAGIQQQSILILETRNQAQREAFLTAYMV